MTWLLDLAWNFLLTCIVFTGVVFAVAIAVGACLGVVKCVREDVGGQNQRKPRTQRKKKHQWKKPRSGHGFRVVRPD